MEFCKYESIGLNLKPARKYWLKRSSSSKVWKHQNLSLGQMQLVSNWFWEEKQIPSNWFSDGKQTNDNYSSTI